VENRGRFFLIAAGVSLLIWAVCLLLHPGKPLRFYEYTQISEGGDDQLPPESRQREGSKPRGRATPPKNGARRATNGKDNFRAAARQSAMAVFRGAPIMDYLPTQIDLKTRLFLEELERMLRADLLENGDFGRIEKIFEDVGESNQENIGLKMRLLTFSISLESDAGPSFDLSKKLSLFEALNRSTPVLRLSEYLAEVGFMKALGPVDWDVMSDIPVEERKYLLRGMARAGDLESITTALSAREEAERAEVLKYAVTQLMENHPGKTITYIDKMEDSDSRFFCLSVAVDSLRAAAGDLEADEWAKEIVKSRRK